MSKVKKIIICLLGLTISLGYIETENLIVKANEVPLENSNVNALISAFEYVNKEAYVDRYNNTTAYIHTIDGYNNKQEIEFDYIKNQVKSIKDINEIMLLSETEGETSGDTYTYNEDGLLTSITTPSTSYTYNYNENGVLLSQGINGNNIITNNYNNDEMLMSKNYINGTTKQYLYNTNNKISSIKVNDVTVAEYIYTNELLTQYKDLRTNITYNYSYNEDNKVISMNSSNGYSVNYVYDENNETIIRKNYNYNGVNYVTGIEDNGLRTTYSEVTERRDISDRIKEYNLTTELGYTISNYFDYAIDEPYYEELTEENHDEKMKNATADMKVDRLYNHLYNFEYEYDSNSNIVCKYTDNNTEIFQYDNLGKFRRFVNNSGTYDYSYDENGNILTKENMTYNYIKASGIDLLRYVSGKGYNFNYDSMGNPVYYKNKSLVWEGRELKSYGSNISYTYDMSGVRTSKTVNGVTTTYVTEGDKVIFEKIPNKELISYFYMNNEIIGIVYNNTPYYYIKNTQKDIVSIVDLWGEEVVSYKYDPWGQILSIDGYLKDTLGVDNPYRYRSYRYDNETNLYYLVSRYYDPELGRFVNQDDTRNLQYTILDTSYSKNLYMYAKNNPMTYYDPLGNMAKDFFDSLHHSYSELKIMPDMWMVFLTLALNGKNLMKGFHEAAQLVATKNLVKNGYYTEVEYKIGSKWADIYAKKSGINYLYEVKPNKSGYINKALSLLNEYLVSTGFLKGPKIYNYSVDGSSVFTIDFIPKIKMEVYFQQNGVILYSFKKEKKKFFNKEILEVIDLDVLLNILLTNLLIAIITAGVIWDINEFENVASLNVGRADDLAFVGVAAFAFCTALSRGI